MFLLEGLQELIEAQKERNECDKRSFSHNY